MSRNMKRYWRRKNARISKKPATRLQLRLLKRYGICPTEKGTACIILGILREHEWKMDSVARYRIERETKGRTIRIPQIEDRRPRVYSDLPPASTGIWLKNESQGKSSTNHQRKYRSRRKNMPKIGKRNLHRPLVDTAASQKQLVCNCSGIPISQFRGLTSPNRQP